MDGAKIEQTTMKGHGDAFRGNVVVTTNEGQTAGVKKPAMRAGFSD